MRIAIAYGLRFAGDLLGAQFAADDTAVLRCWFVGPRGTRATSQKRVRVGYNRFSGGPVSGQAAPHQTHFDIPNGSSELLPEGGRVYRNDLSSASGSEASEETRHIDIGEFRLAEVRTSTLRSRDFRIAYSRISDSVRRRGIYTKRGGTVEFNHVQGPGPGCDRHPRRRARLLFRQSLRQHRFGDYQRPRPPGPRAIGSRARKGLRLECEYVSDGGGLFSAAHRAMVVGNDATLTVGYFPAGFYPDRAGEWGAGLQPHRLSRADLQQENTTWIQEPRART